MSVTTEMKPKGLIIPNVAYWILGDIGRHIVSAYANQYDLYYVSGMLLSRRPDILQYLLPRVNLVHALDESVVPAIVNVTSHDRPPLITWIHHVTQWSPYHQLAADHSELLIASTPEWADHIGKLANRPSQVRVVRYGVDPDRFRRCPDARAQFGIPDGAFTLGFIASKGSNQDNDRKGIDTLFKVLASLKPKISHLHIVFAGPGWSDEVSRLQASGLSASTTGYIAADHLPAFYSSLDAYLMTSRVEGGPCTVLEAMACETPVVATRVGLVGDTVVHGTNGFSATPNDAVGLATAIEQLARSPEYARQIGRSARMTIESGHSWRETLSALAGPYAELTARSHQLHTLVPGKLPNPAKLLAATYAADSLRWGLIQIRRNRQGATQGLQTTRELLRGTEVSDIVRGVGLMTKLAFRY